MDCVQWAFVIGIDTYWLCYTDYDLLEINMAGVRKGVTYAADNAVVDCLFCRIIAGKEQSTMVKPSIPHPDLLAFFTINPSTDCHILVTPRLHIQNVDALTKHDIPLLEDMQRFGNSLLTTEQQKDSLLVFHLPPWNSIDHLHLHVIANRSTMSFFNGYFKYLPGTAWCNTIDTVIARLKK